MTACERLGVCHSISCPECPQKYLIGDRLKRIGDRTTSDIFRLTGLDHQTLEKVDTTDSDKRSELCLYLLARLGVAITGANLMVCNLDKRECPTERLLTRKKVIHRVLLSGGFPIGYKHPHLVGF